MLSERNYWRDEVQGCILFNIIVLPTLETVRDICWLANLPKISNTVRNGNKSNNACGFPFWISKNSDKISQKINPQKSSKDFDVQNPEKIINNRATTHRHAWPQISSDPRISHSNLCRSEKNSTKLMQPRSTKLENCKPKNGCTRLHAPS